MFSTFISHYILERNNICRQCVNMGYPWSSFSVHLILLPSIVDVWERVPTQNVSKPQLNIMIIVLIPILISAEKENQRSEIWFPLWVSEIVHLLRSYAGRPDAILILKHNVLGTGRIACYVTYIYNFFVVIAWLWYWHVKSFILVIEVVHNPLCDKSSFDVNKYDRPSNFTF